MPEDKGKSVKAPKSKSNDDFAPQLVKSKSEIPKNAVLKIDSDGEEYWEVETKHEETMKKMYSPSSGKKSTGTPRKKDPEKSSTFGSTVQRYKLPPPEVIPPEQTGLYGGISTYEKIDPAKQWGADYGITTVETPDAEGRYTNTSRKYNIDKEGREVTYDEANPLKNFKDGKFVPTYTGRTIDDIRKEYTTQKIETPAMSGVDKANPNYKGSLMMPGTKATRIAGGGGGEFNQRNIADVPNALSTAPVGYIEQKYDTQGNPIVTPNVGVQMDTKNITPLRKGEMEVGRMYNIENPIEIKGKFAKGGIVSKIKGYYDGGEVEDENYLTSNPNTNNGSFTPSGNKGNFYQNQNVNSGVVGMNDQYTAQNNMQAKKAIDENKKKANQQKARNVANGIGEGMGGIGSAYYNSQPAQNEGESARNAGMAAVSQMGGIGGMIGGIAAIGDKIGKPIKARKESMNAEGKLNNESDARTTAIGASFLSPSKALATRSSYAGGWTDVSGKGYTKSLEDKAQKQLQEVKDANTASKQQQAILARNNQEENPTITNPYNLTGVTFDENQNMILADGQQFDKNRPMMNRGGVVGKIKNMYADGGDIKGKGTAKSDSIMAEVKEGSFVVPAENAELAKGIRKLYLKAPNKKANLKQEEGEAVKLSNGEHLFTPEENEYLESIGIDLEDLAPNAENGEEEMAKGGLTASKARMILHDKKVHGKPLTDKQRKFFGAISNGASIKGYAAGGDVDGVDPIKELARLNKEKEDAEKSAKAESDAEKSARDKKIADFKAKVESYDRKADRKNKVSEWDKKRNDSKTKLDALNKSYEEASKSFEAANTPTTEQKAKGIKAGTLTESQRQYKESLLKKIQEAKSEFDNADRTYNYVKDDNNYDASGNIKVKPKTATVAPKTETKPTVVTENVPTTKPSLKAPKVTTSKVTVDNLPAKDLSLQGLKQDAELKTANQAAMQEASIANAPTRQAVINDANVVNNENYLASKPKSKNAWADKLSNIDPTAFVGIGQSALGLNMLGKEKRPIDKAVIDPTYNAAVNRAQQDALFGLTPEQRFMAEQDIQGGLNDAKFAGLNSSASDSFNRNRAAINDAWKNKLGLKQADAEMRMNKQKYADVMAADRATILAANRRQAYNDAMNTFQQKQKAGSELIGAGLMNTIDAYRFKRSMEQRDAAEKQKTDFVNKI